MNFFTKIKNYFISSYQEIKKVSWPTKKQVINFALSLLVLCLIVIVFIGFFDFLFLEGVRIFIIK
ncbi:MAG TPA: preprotein translocase subunit SecE [Candidatus Paceibacterota bacterium]|jgi:preprotein translocase subunit SecE|nr:preprotein translocase subunit SecE [Candidatus Paceibacterota bacterium]HRS48020.1 preprotein translocase subunit SecE [Candidatus Paceibacterota bacterium]